MACCAALLAPALAVAGPPYLTDDPQPTEPGHWEIYNFVQGTVGYGALLGEAGLDLNYGGAKNLQLTAVLPIGFYNENGFSATGLRTGTGMVELAAKYEFLHQSDNGWLPDVSVFPPIPDPDRTQLRLRPHQLLPANLGGERLRSMVGVRRRRL